MFKNKYWLYLILAIIVIIIGLFLLFVPIKGNASYIKPTPTPTPYPYHYSCNYDKECVKREGNGDNTCDTNKDCKPTITPTPTITITPTPTSTPSAGIGQEPNNPSTDTTSTPGSATCNIAHVSPGDLVFKRETPTSVSFTWGLSTDSMDNQSINYGYSASDLSMGVILPATSTSYTIEGLQSNKTIYAQVCSYINGCGYCSTTVDP